MVSFAPIPRLAGVLLEAPTLIKDAPEAPQATLLAKSQGDPVCLRYHQPLVLCTVCRLDYGEILLDGSPAAWYLG